MSHLSRDRIVAAKKDIESFRPLEEFCAYSSELINLMPSDQFFVAAGMTFARDAWIASRVARGLDATRVRLVPDNWPDFEIEVDGTSISFEATEVDLPDRRRSDEYRAVAAGTTPRMTHDPVEAWAARAAQIPAALQTAARSKAAKRYPPTADLVIYLNIDERGIRHEQIVDDLSENTKEASRAFRRVWVLWKATLYLVWDNGRLASLAVSLASDPELSP
ncbi:MAG: hypothetical protein WDM94_00715 [Bauldia sp.]